MAYRYLLTKKLFKLSREISQEETTKKFKSDKKEIHPKAKELITKYRRGLIWKDI